MIRKNILCNFKLTKQHWPIKIIKQTCHLSMPIHLNMFLLNFMHAQKSLVIYIIVYFKKNQFTCNTILYWEIMLTLYIKWNEMPFRSCILYIMLKHCHFLSIFQISSGNLLAKSEILCNNCDQNAINNSFIWYMWV